MILIGEKFILKEKCPLQKHTNDIVFKKVRNEMGFNFQYWK
jgi:hypothetical protein